MTKKREKIGLVCQDTKKSRTFALVQLKYDETSNDIRTTNSKTTE